MDAGGVEVSLQTMRHSDKDELFVCPYDPVHRVSAQRFVRHILKCRKNFPCVEKATCPFNARHVIPKPELRHHLSCCPDRRMIELEINYERYGDEDELKGDLSVPPYSDKPVDFGDDENWDDEIESAKRETEAFSSISTHSLKPVNRRREAMKRMKEEMRKETEEAMAREAALRVQRRPMSFPVAMRRQVLQSTPDEQDPGIQAPVSDASPRKPHLAANFQSRHPNDV